MAAGIRGSVRWAAHWDDAEDEDEDDDDDQGHPAAGGKVSFETLGVLALTCDECHFDK